MYIARLQTFYHMIRFFLQNQILNVDFMFLREVKFTKYKLSQIMKNQVVLQCVSPLQARQQRITGRGSSPSRAASSTAWTLIAMSRQPVNRSRGLRCRSRGALFLSRSQPQEQVRFRYLNSSHLTPSHAFLFLKFSHTMVYMMCQISAYGKNCSICFGWQKLNLWGIIRDLVANH